MNTKKCVIVVPIYKKLDEIERFSFNTLISLVKNIDIVIIKPSSMSFAYLGYKEVSFNDDYFKSTDSYSELCKSHEFYAAFSEYEYMLIYQLDCVLLKNDILKWCEKGYDYIGAPIISSNANWDIVPAIGNGGLSLRRIEKFLELTNAEYKFLKKYSAVYNNDSKKELYDKYEDLYFCEFVSSNWKFTTPSFKIACKFAIDMNPDHISMSELPMGIHAFDKNIPFWRKVVNIPANVVNKCYIKNRDFIDAYYSSKKSK